MSRLFTTEMAVKAMQDGLKAHPAQRAGYCYAGLAHFGGMAVGRLERWDDWDGCITSDDAEDDERRRKATRLRMARLRAWMSRRNRLAALATPIIPFPDGPAWQVLHTYTAEARYLKPHMQHINAESFTRFFREVREAAEAEGCGPFEHNFTERFEQRPGVRGRPEDWLIQSHRILLRGPEGALRRLQRRLLPYLCDNLTLYTNGVAPPMICVADLEDNHLCWPINDRAEGGRIINAFWPYRRRIAPDVWRPEFRSARPPVQAEEIQKWRDLAAAASDPVCVLDDTYLLTRSETDLVLARLMEII